VNLQEGHSYVFASFLHLSHLVIFSFLLGFHLHAAADAVHFETSVKAISVLLGACIFIFISALGVRSGRGV
jgi:hypothetical protein